MSVWHWLRWRLSLLLRRHGREDDLERELQSHLELEVEEQKASGVLAEEARYAARRAFGNPVLVAEKVRESWGLIWLEHFFRDVRYGARSLGKSPGFTAVAVLTLALGIGANTAIFSVIDGLMFQPLPFSEPDQLVRISSINNGLPVGPSRPDLRDFAQGSHTFQQMVIYDAWRKNVRFGNASEPEQMAVGLVPAAYFEILHLQPLLGRLFTEDENEFGRHHVVIISASVWKDHFAGDRAILGQKIRINDESYTVVGVMPDSIPDWVESRRIVLWTPLAFAPSEGEGSETSRAGRGFTTLARLKPGVSLEQAQADLATIAARLAAEHPIDQGIGVVVRPLADTRVGTLRPVLFMLMGAVSLILLIACSNLANLLMARNSARQRELAVRLALGAGRGGLVRQLLAETLLLSFIGGAAGLALAELGLAALSRMHPEKLPQLATIGIDSRVLLFTVSASLLTSLLFGLAPAITGTRVNLIDALKDGGRSSTAGPGHRRLRDALVVVEMALSLMLLMGASLLIQSIVRLQSQGLGIRPDHLLKGHFYLPDVRYPDPGAIARFSDEFGQRVRALPGVVEASVTTVFPPANRWSQMFKIAGSPNASRIEDIPTAKFGLTDAHFLKTFGIPLIRGRDFSESDTASSLPVCLISEDFARRYLPGEDPIGRQIHIGPPAGMGIVPGVTTTDSSDVVVIGVIGNFRNSGLALPPEPQIVVLYSQHPFVNYGFKDIVIRTASTPHFIAPSVRRQLHAMDSEMPFAEVQTMEELIAQQTGGQRFTTLLLALFAAAGLSLAVVGVYGVLSYLVRQRTQEVAVRLAVGARPVNVLWLVVRQGLKLATIGAASGLLGAWTCRQVMSGLLFGISPVDPVTLAG